MATTYLWQVLCLLIFVVAQKGGDAQGEGVGADFHQGSEADADSLDSPVKAGFKDTVQAGPDPQLPILESEHPSQPVASTSGDQDKDIPPLRDRDIPPLRSETSNTDTDQKRVQGTDGQVSNSFKVSNVLDSYQNEAGDTNKLDDTQVSKVVEGLLSSSTNTEVGNDQLPKENTQMNQVHDALDSHSSKKEADMGILGSVEGPFSKSNAEPVNEEETVGQVQTKHDDDGNRHIDETDVGVLGQSLDIFPDSDTNRKAEGGQGNVRQLQKSQDDNGFRSSDTNEADIGVLGSSSGFFSGSKAESEHKPETGKNQVHVGELDTSYGRPSVPEIVKRNQSTNVLDSTGNFTTSSKHSVVLSGSADPNGNLNEVRPKEDPRNNNFEEAYQGRQPPQVNNRPDSQGGEGGDDDEDIPWDINPFPENTDKQTKEKGDGAAEDHLKEQVSNSSVTESDEDDFGDDYYDEDDDDWWYYDPDARKGNEDKVSTSTPSAWSSRLVTKPGPAEAVEGDVGEKDEKQGKEPPDIHEGVIEIAHVMQKKNKNMHGPKESILLYTALIVILIGGIVIFTLWKNAARMGSRSKNEVTIVPTGEEGKRLLDHPFV